MTDPSYVPGVCNIGGSEVRFRKTFGWIFVPVTLAAFAALIALDAPRWWRLLLALPAFGAAIGLLQGYLGFCAAYGLGGVFNVTRPLGHAARVRDDAARTQDRVKAVRVAALAALLSITVAAAAYWAPF